MNYQELAMRTKNKDLIFEDTLKYAGYKFLGETGELSEIFGKNLGQGHPFNLEHMELELGDIMWYVALTCDTLNIDLKLLLSTLDYKIKSYSDILEVVLNINDNAVEIGRLLLNIVNYDRKSHFDLIIKLALKDLISNIYLLCDHFDVKFQDVLIKNIEKLKKRYPSGFESINSIRRTI